MDAARRVFSREFKLESAQLVLDKGYSISQACLALDIGETALRRWILQLKSEREGGKPSGKALSGEHHYIQQLEARIKFLEMEKAILKKATALLMSDNWRNTA